MEETNTVWLCKLFRGFGTVPYDKDFKMTPILLGYGLLLVLISVVLSSYALIHQPPFHFQGTWVDKLIVITNDLIGPCNNVFYIYWLLSNKQILLDIKHCVSILSSEVLMLPSTYRPKYFISIYIITLLFLVTFIIQFILLGLEKGVIGYIQFFIDSLFSLSIVSQFKEFIHTTCLIYSSLEMGSSERYAQISEIILRARRGIRKLYGPLLLVSLSRSFVFSVIHMYHVFGHMTRNGHWMNITYSYWTLQFVAPIIIAIRSSNEASSAVSKPTCTLSKDDKPSAVSKA